MDDKELTREAKIIAARLIREAAYDVDNDLGLTLYTKEERELIRKKMIMFARWIQMVAG